jgi:monomeric sarcosine oxidase
VRDRYPAFNLPEDYIAIWDPRAGILMPETCIEVHLEAAQKNGADLRLNERATYWGVEGDHVVITTNLGEYRARFLVLAAGAWVSELLQDLRLPLTVERQVLCWFQPNAQQPMFAPDDFPIFIWERSQGDQFYGFPDLGNGVKVARMHHGETTSPNGLRRDASEDDISSVRKFLRESIPAANGKCVSTQVCMFTNTPDTNFIIDFHPQHRNVLIASPCSGHGFKFSSAIGEIVTDLIVGDDSQYDLSLFRLDRFHN